VIEALRALGVAGVLGWPLGVRLAVE